MASYFTTLKGLCVQNKALSAMAAVSCVGAAVLWIKKFKGKEETKKRVCGKDYPENTVMLHVGPWTTVQLPSLGHFNVKLQMYLNLNNIPYQMCYEFDYGPKNKIPWIEYNGVTMGDSQLIINYLNKEFNVDLNKTLSKEERAQAWAIQKWLEEFTYWLNVYTRWYILIDDQLSTGPVKGLPAFLIDRMPVLKRQLKDILIAVGIGRHSDEEVFEMMRFDLRQLSTILGDKKYLMGGDRPTEVDCAAFGMLSQIRWGTPDSCPGKQLLMGELTNLVAYTDRIKENFWPDWDKYTSKPQS